MFFSTSFIYIYIAQYFNCREFMNKIADGVDETRKKLKINDSDGKIPEGK